MRTLATARYGSFVVESWKIEGIRGLNTNTLNSLCGFHNQFIEQDDMTLDHLVKAASFFTEGKGKLRREKGMDVRVGNHIPMSGGTNVVYELAVLCGDAEDMHPYDLHKQFENIHPFLDGNGRTGRMLWAWAMHQRGERYLHLGFLHKWYYQSLDADR